MITNGIHLLDISGAVFSFLSTIFYIKADVRAWPFGLVAILINMTLYFLTGIYGDMGREAIYLVSTFYGWYAWLYGGNNHQQLPITSLNWSQFIRLASIGVISTVVLAYSLHHFTNSQVPWWDASTTVMSLIAQWMICRKIIQCWHLWFIVDALYAGLYLYKGIPAHGLLLMIYVGLAVAGYFNWRSKSVSAIFVQ